MVHKKNETELLTMRKSSAYDAWLLLLSGLPRGIAIFVVAVAGFCLGLGLAVVGIGIPILAGTMAWCEKRMREDQLNWGRWRRGEKRRADAAPAVAADGEFAEDEAVPAPVSRWKRWFAAVVRIDGYRALFYSILQFPIRVVLFVPALAVPAAVFGLLLQPAAYKVSVFLYDYELYYNGDWLDMLLPPLTPFQRSLVAAGVGLVLLLFLAPLVRGFGRLYDAWVRSFAARRRGVTAAFASPPPAEQFETQASIPLH